MLIDASIAVSLLLQVVGAKFAIDSFRLLRSSQFRAVEKVVHPSGKLAPISPKQSLGFLIGLGLCAYFSAWIQYFFPSHPPFTGSWSWLNSLVYQNLGNNGLVLLWTIVGTILLFSASNMRKP